MADNYFDTVVTLEFDKNQGDIPEAVSQRFQHMGSVFRWMAEDSDSVENELIELALEVGVVTDKQAVSDLTEYLDGETDQPEALYDCYSAEKWLMCLREHGCIAVKVEDLYSCSKRRPFEHSVGIAVAAWDTENQKMVSFNSYSDIAKILGIPHTAIL